MKKILLPTFVVIVLISALVAATKVQWTKAGGGTIYINADGSVEGADKIFSSDNVTYTFLGDINDSIVVLRSNITIDGAGFTLNGTEAELWYGFQIEGYTVAVNVTIRNVNIVGCEVGIGLISTNDNKVLECNITDCNYGIWSSETWDNIISGNVISNNTCGIYFDTTFDNEVFGNNITDNDNGVWLSASSSNNKFHHNYFINNINQTQIESGEVYPSNAWDDGYPSGGNYWSDYEERYPGVGDAYSGPNQDVPGSDGFWDDPYVIAENNQDNYPIVPEFSLLINVSLFMIATLSIVMIYRRKQNI
ncbi:MAG: NosD domain-containing protein [Candidatus Bathyarchaeia archaeon]